MPLGTGHDAKMRLHQIRLCAQRHRHAQGIASTQPWSRCALGIGLRLNLKVVAMDSFLRSYTTDTGTGIQIEPGLYLWRGNGIVLMGQVEDDRFVLARGWIENDRLSHVRRWRFATPEQFAGQVRRLVMEASSNDQLAAEERLACMNWLSSSSSL